jgi:hypothetical protein
MMEQCFQQVHQDSCFKGGSNVTSLWELGNAMETKFNSSAALNEDGTYNIGQPTVEALLKKQNWDYIVINDHTQAPARDQRKQESLTTLQEKYLPLVRYSTVVFIMTWAYKEPVKNSSDLGGFDHFTDLLWKGYQEYARLFPDERVRIAPVGLAFQYVRRNLGEDFWKKLYAPDEFHPSPYGTWLEACVLYCTIVGEQSPLYDTNWWETSRYLHPEMPFPTDDEADTLRDVAWCVCERISSK